MKKIFMLSLSYIRKAKGQTISFLLISVMAAILLNIGLFSLINYNSLFDKKCEELNTADVYFLMNEAEYLDDFYDYVKNSKEVSESELVDAVLQMSEFQYGQTVLSNVNVFLNADDKNNISKFTFVERADVLPENPIYVPYVLKVSANYKLGDDFERKVMGKTYHYKIAGFVEEMMTGSANSSNMGFLLNEDDFNELRDADKGIYKAKMINMKLYDKKKAPSYISEVNNYMSVQFPSSNLRSSTSMDYIKFARMGIANIGSYVIIVFSMLIVFVSLILTRFRIKNSIESDMKNIGALKALGYTSNQLISSILLQFALLAGVGCILGALLSYGLLPVLRDLYTSNSGMVWNLSFDMVCFILTILIIVLSTAVMAYLGSRRIRKLPPVIALRGGVLTHSFKKNVIPFDKVNGNIHILMSAKGFLQELRQNMMIMVIVMAVFFQMSFGFVFYYNAVVEEENFINLVTGEIGDATLVLNPNNYDENLLSDIQNDPQVRKAFYYDSSISITFSEEEVVNGTVNLCEDYSIIENPKVYEGRNPIHNNEVALKGTSAVQMNKKVGDTLNLTVGDQSFPYLITGLMQDGNGTYAVQMTYDAYKKIVPMYKPSMILLYLNDDENTPDFLDYVNEKYADKIFAAHNSKEQVYSIIRPMTDTMKMSLRVIVIATLCIIALILQLVIKTNMVRKKTGLGIQKSLGFTTFQLMLQNTLSLLPAFIIGSFLGAVLSKALMNKVAELVMRSAGVMKVDFVILPTMLLGMGIGITVFAFATSMYLSFKLRKITAYSLISE